MNIGYIGLGNMGGALAKRLQLTHQLFVFDQNAAAVQQLTAAGATACQTAAAVASECDVILLCLPTSDHVRAVLFGEDGLTGTLAPGTVVVDQTTGDPAATREMAAELVAQGVGLVDAPVSGGVKGAEAGTIAIMMGGDPDHLTRVEPTLRAISPNVFHTGGVGTGHVMKLVNNLMSCSQRLLTFEAMALAAKNGMDPEKAVEVLLASGGRNGFLERIMGPQILHGKLAANFTLGLAHKDVRLACQLGIDSEVPMFFGNLTRELYQMCISEMGAGEQVDSAALVMDRLAKTQVVPADYSLE